MSTTAEPDLLRSDDRGLWCARGGFHIDPWRAAPVAVITHAHGDHATWGSGVYWCSAEGAGVLRRRVGANADIRAVPWGQRVRLGDTDVSFHPAGHVLGSAQVRVEPVGGGPVWVASGDYKRDADPTCSPFEVVACDVFITEATFAMPIYRWRETREVVDEIRAWWAGNAAEGKVSALFCYALGKAQRLLAELGGTALQSRREQTGGGAGGQPLPGPVFIHGSVRPLVDEYRVAGVALPETRLVTEEVAAGGVESVMDDGAPRAGAGGAGGAAGGDTPGSATHDGAVDAKPARAKRRKRNAAEFAGALVVAPPSAAGSPWMRNFGAAERVETAFASGWMRVRGVRRWRGYDRGFVLSDHADWPGLIRTVRETGASRVLATHGSVGVLSRYLREQGVEAQPLATGYRAEAEEE